jgi:hypothetical protein
MGAFWTPVDVRRYKGHLRNGLGLPDENSCTKWVSATLESAVGLHFGPADSYQSKKYGVKWDGGLTQIYFPGGSSNNVRVVAQGAMNPAC